MMKRLILIKMILSFFNRKRINRTITRHLTTQINDENKVLYATFEIK